MVVRKHSRFAKRVNVANDIEIHFFSKSLFPYWMAVFLPASSFMFYTPMELRFASQSAHSEMQKVQKLHSSNKNEQKCFFFFASIEIIQKQNLFILKLSYLLFYSYVRQYNKFTFFFKTVIGNLVFFLLFDLYIFHK